MGHEIYIYMFLSFFAIVLGEVIEREKSFILHSSALTSPVLLQAFHPEVHGSVRRFTGATQERGHFRSANLDVHEGPYAPPVDPASIPSASIAAAFDAPAESSAAVTERILNVLDGKRTWEATVAYLKPKILAAAPSWREGWNSTVSEILREEHGDPGKPFLLVAFSGGKPYFRSEYTARARGMSHSYLELALRGEGAFLTALAAVFPDFPDVVFAINYGRQHGSYLVDLAFPGFSRGYSPADGTDLNAWPINAELLQSCACKELESDSAYLAKIAVPWESREPRAFFRGRPSSPQRWRLAKIADGREDIFDVGVLRVMDKSIGVEHGSLRVGRSLSLIGFIRIGEERKN